MTPEANSRMLEQLAQLSPEKRALFEARLKEKLQGSGNKTGIVRGEESSTAAPSFTQQRFWFLDQLEPNLPVYHEWTAVRLRGPLDAAALEDSVNAVVRRHEALRTTFSVRDGQPIQVIAPALKIPVHVIELQNFPASGRWDEARRLATAETQRPFDLASGPLLRVTLFRMEGEEHILLLTFHHIVIDAWSATIFYRELGAIYAALLRKQPAGLPELPVRYSDFAVWQRAWLNSPAFASQLSYWRKQLAGLTPLQIPTDRPRPHRQSYRGEQQSVVLAAPLAASLQAISQSAGASLFMTLLAAFQVLLHRYTGQDDIVVGSPIANRNRREVEGLIGCFTNTLALRSDLSGNPEFRTLLSRVRATVLDALTHQDLPFEKLMEELPQERDLSRTPIFQVMFVFNNTALKFNQFGSVQAEPVDFQSTIARFDLTLSVMELESGLKAELIYNTDLFDEVTARNMAGHLQTLLGGIAADPERRIANLPLLTTAERNQLLTAWNDTHTDYPRNACLHELFEQQVNRTPDAEALVFENERLTYRELNARANQLAHYLRTMGVGPELSVGICLERSVDLLVGVLGVLKAGGTYLALDPAYPAERIAYILQDSQPQVLLTQASVLPSLPAVAARVLCPDSERQAIAQQPESNPDGTANAGNLAYILYTSGSTGRPKGVEIEHRSAVALVDWTRHVYPQEEIAGVLASTSICFDLSVFEIFVPLSRGGKIILALNALHLPTMPAASEVTLINTVPSVMAELIRNNALPASVTVANLAGEPLKKALTEPLYKHKSVRRVFNLYGPSETTTYSTFSLVDRTSGAEPTIGRPIANTQVYILDSQMQPVPAGVIGELYIGGEGVARGYRNQPELTAEKFLRNPFLPEDRNGRMYKTGDLVRYLPLSSGGDALSGANLEFLGRRDNQVKLRGFRIELGEIETVLSQHPAVREAVVVAREDVPGDTRLVAYIRTTDAQDPSPDSLKNTLSDHVRRSLPHFMVPAAFVFLDAMPLTPNGKVDRRSLPAPIATHRSAPDTFTPPGTPTEKRIADIWTSLLGVDQAGIHDDFFALGGHSLLATQVISRCREAFETEISLISLFEERTIAGLAGRIDQIRLSRELQQTVYTENEVREEIAL